MTNKENQTHGIDSETGKDYLLFTPEDLLDNDSCLLPSRISIPISMGISVEVINSGELKYIFPDSYSDEEIIDTEIQIEEKLFEHKELLKSKKPY